MKALVTGVAGQLGHDVMNELAKRNIAGVGTDLKEVYSCVMDGTPVTTMPYISMDITDPESVRKGIIDSGVDFVIHCAAWTAVDKAEFLDGLCIQRQRDKALGAGGCVRTARRLRTDEGGRGSRSARTCKEVLHSENRLGLRRERKELY